MAAHIVCVVFFHLFFSCQKKFVACPVPRAIFEIHSLQKQESDKGPLILPWAFRNSRCSHLFSKTTTIFFKLICSVLNTLKHVFCFLFFFSWKRKEIHAYLHRLSNVSENQFLGVREFFPSKQMSAANRYQTTANRQYAR